MLSDLTKKITIRFKRIFNGAINAFFFPLSRLVRRNPQHWAFGHQAEAFAGNSKYLFIWIAQNRPDICATWITADKSVRREIRAAGYDCEERWAWRGLREALISSVYVYCHGPSDINIPLSNGALRINLWHGVGLKATQYGDPSSTTSIYDKYARSVFRPFFLEYLIAPAIMVSTSTFTQQHFAAQCRMLPTECPPLGYSRLDPCLDEVLMRGAKKCEILDAEFRPEEFKELYVYLPTFRDTGREFLAAALPCMEQLSESLKRRNALMYIKLHSYTPEAVSDGLSNIRPWPKGADLYAHIDEIDCLVTDYSSVLYDFIYVKERGVILYTFDIEEYMEADRPLLYPFDENTAGLRVNTFEALCEAIKDGTGISSVQGFSAVRNKFWGAERTLASSAIVAAVEKLLSPVGADHDRQK